MDAFNRASQSYADAGAFGEQSFGRATPIPPSSTRERLHESVLSIVENLSMSPGFAVTGYEREYQVVVPYSGFFAYAVGRRRWLLDSSSVLFVSPAREYSDDHPAKGVGHAAIVLTPSLEILDELCGSKGAGQHEAFADASRRASRDLHFLAYALMRSHREDRLQKDELTLTTLRSALGCEPRRTAVAPRLIGRAKEYLHARGYERVTLGEIAKAVGVSPVYLTQEFARAEGIPLYRYQLQLRLSQALFELRDCPDITRLALDLGFSSHSHFTATFRNRYGVTPSEFRRSGARSVVAVSNASKAVSCRTSQTGHA